MNTENIKQLINKPLPHPAKIHHMCQQNIQTSQNPTGYINLATSVNQRVMEKSIQYLPQFLTQKNLHLIPNRGTDELNKLLSQDTNFTSQQTFAFNNLQGILAIFVSKGKVKVQGDFEEIDDILEHMGAQKSCFEEADVVIVFASDENDVQKYVGFQKMTLIVVREKQWMKQPQSGNIFYAYQQNFEEDVKCGVCFTKNIEEINQFFNYFFFYRLSSLISTKITKNFKPIHKSQKKSNQNQKKSNQRLKENIKNMLYQQNQTEIEKENILLGMGAATCLHHLMFVLFQKNAVVSMDEPYYYFLLDHFEKSQISLHFEDIFKNNLLYRARQAYEKGSKGFITVNPHNPTGKIFHHQQISQLCEWGIKHPDFHLIFDEIYINSVENLRSAAEYANNYPNIHVARGFGKDYGLIGFKVAYLISSNQKVKRYFSKITKMTSPQSYTLNTISSMLEKSNNGKDIYTFGQQQIKKSTNLAIEQLKKLKIDFIKPQGGCFIVINLSKFVKIQSQEEEKYYWKILFYQYKINFALGYRFRFQGYGFYRICHVFGDEYMREGFKRLGRFIEDYSKSQ